VVNIPLLLPSTFYMAYLCCILYAQETNLSNQIAHILDNVTEMEVPVFHVNPGAAN
jgi:hypothetical protein